ncbi:hypothetical protein CR513_61441, partial [Mucuna pruriens]
MHFNGATVQVNNPNQKFFVKAFHKGLRVGQFNDSLELRRLASMEEIRAWAKKHFEAEEDLADWLKAKCEVLPGLVRNNQGHPERVNPHGEVGEQINPIHPIKGEESPKFEGGLLWLSSRWDKITMNGQIEKLTCEGHLDRFVQTQRNIEAREHNPLRPNRPKAPDEEWPRDRSQMKSRPEPPY